MKTKVEAQKALEKSYYPRIREDIVIKIANRSSLPKSKVRSALNAVAKSMH